MTEKQTESEDNTKEFTIADFHALIKKNANKEVKKYDYSGIPTNRTRPTWGQWITDKIFH